ncbi:unnamed protein product [Macrosiphum euphorbiae]|uniref:DUF4806 domain-containing protein n=1 Tax=Macrosiphum euphorbiae TaxID=13131 RepID=A0AAV0Y8S5_9HEMI|nr:unnamed protein product [Macrosiphum euphorbiae]
MINSDNDDAEGTSFFNRKLKFKTDNSKERRNNMENIRYISPRNSPDFSNNEVPFDLEKSTGRKSFSLCEDHDAIDDKEFKKQIIRHVMYFKVELKHITNTLTNNHYELLERVQSIEKFLEDKPTKFYEQTNVDINCMSDCSIPIDNLVDLNTLEDKTLGDQEFKKALINELSHVGGKNVKTAVKRIMSKLFTNCFLAEYSFTGKKGKKKFCDLFIFPIILIIIMFGIDKTDKFIQCIHNNNSIWEMGSREYSDKHLKLKSWMNIGSSMYLDWNELEKNAKDERGKEITHTYS